MFPRNAPLIICPPALPMSALGSFPSAYIHAILALISLKRKRKKKNLSWGHVCLSSPYPISLLLSTANLQGRVLCLLPPFSELPFSSQAIPGRIPTLPLLTSHQGLSLKAATMPSPRLFSSFILLKNDTKFPVLMIIPFLKCFVTCLCFSSF